MSKLTEQLILLLVCLLLIFPLAWLTKICWNAVIPYLFGLPTLTYWRAFALQWLISCLFGKISPKIGE